jgi:NAD(P)-dependent dehydrogenase (short-subunit alcohol dehydrogenase family)
MTKILPGLGPNTVVAITAAASGIGRRMAEEFLAQGTRVHICDIDGEAIAAFAHDNPTATTSITDVSDPAAVAAMMVDLEAQHGRLDILVNNAGIAGPTAAVEDIEIEAWNQTINVDLNGTFYTTRVAVPLLKRRGGCIINMASNAALFGCPLRSPYTAAKWAINGLTKTWAMELGTYGIRVNALCPGSVAGERIDAVIERDALERGTDIASVRASYARQSAMRSFVEADDVANTALFLASDMGRFISGQTIGIDGFTESLSDFTNAHRDTP